MKPCTYLIGIDGGGTKTEGVLTDRSGHLLARAPAGASNPNDVTPDGSAEVIGGVIRELIAAAGVSLTDCSVFGGISGAINHRLSLVERLNAAFPKAGRIDVRSDVANLLSSELPSGDGACVICGTGMCCFLRRGREYIRIGGWGYLLDSAGSGYDLGRGAIEAALRDHDGRGPQTLLTPLVAARLGAPAEDCISRLYAEGKPLIASLAPAVFDAADAGDAVAVDLLDRSARAIGECIEAAARMLREGSAAGEKTVMPVILGGSISLRRSPAWRDRIARLTSAVLPVDIRTASTPVIWGSLVEAAARAGGDPIDLDAARAVFLSEYHVTHHA